MAAAATVLVHVLGDVDEMREIAERADDIQRLRNGEVGQQRVELPFDAWRVVRDRAAEADSGLPDGFDPRIAGFAALRSQDVAQQASEKARVLAQGQILVGVGGGKVGSILPGLRRRATLGEVSRSHPTGFLAGHRERGSFSGRA